MVFGCTSIDSHINYALLNLTFCMALYLACGRPLCICDLRVKGQYAFGAESDAHEMGIFYAAHRFPDSCENWKLNDRIDCRAKCQGPIYSSEIRIFIKCIIRWYRSILLFFASKSDSRFIRIVIFNRRNLRFLGKCFFTSHFWTQKSSIVWLCALHLSAAKKKNSVMKSFVDVINSHDKYAIRPWTLHLKCRSHWQRKSLISGNHLSRICVFADCARACVRSIAVNIAGTTFHDGRWIFDTHLLAYS